jgi:hypothetical protein
MLKASREKMNAKKITKRKLLSPNEGGCSSLGPAVFE